MFTALDWTVLVVYILFSVAVGLFASRGKKNFKSYMFGNGSMPWVAIGISLIATSVSATTFLGNPSHAYATDMTYLMNNFGAFIAIIVVGWVFIPRFKKAGITSAYELLENRFSLPVRRLAAVFYSLHLLLRMGILLYAPSLVLAPILGIDIHFAILITAVIATAYTWYGGFKAVVWTDVLQFLVLFGGGAVTLAVIADAVGGFSEMAHLASLHGKTRWLDFSNWDPAYPRNFLSAGLVYAVMEIAIRGCDQQFVQRYLSCKNVSEANRSSILSMVLGVFVSVLFFWVGAALYVFFQVKHVAELPASVNVNEVFPYFLLHILPPGVTGLVVAAIYAAAMSSLSSAINSLGNTTVKDILHIREENAASLSKAKLWTILWAVLSTGCAFMAVRMTRSLLDNALFFTGLFTGPLLALFLLAFFGGYLKTRFVFAGVFLGMAATVILNGIPMCPAFHTPLMGVFSHFWNPLISCSVTFISAVLLHRIFRKA
ncbi:MAG: sodium/solute symporter [Fibrobacter sp.]|jgi:SSS family solute:Na+ symporter|nr:sodium/solute symporter [Fibrobacter sp.]